MKHRKLIALGILIFLILISYPVWYNVAGGKATYKPDLKYVTDAKQCVAPTDYIRSSHMDLLNQWRDEVVRHGDRVYVAFNGQVYNKSLSQTCMNCHSNKSEFCDQCHNYMGVEPYCWDCHIEPKESQ